MQFNVTNIETFSFHSSFLEWVQPSTVSITEDKLKRNLNLIKIIRGLYGLWLQNKKILYVSNNQGYLVDMKEWAVNMWWLAKLSVTMARGFNGYGTMDGLWRTLVLCYVKIARRTQGAKDNYLKLENWYT